MIALNEKGNKQCYCYKEFLLLQRVDSQVTVSVSKVVMKQVLIHGIHLAKTEYFHI